MHTTTHPDPASAHDPPRPWPARALRLLFPALLVTLLACSPAAEEQGGAESGAGEQAAATTQNDLDAAPPKTTRLGVQTVTARQGVLEATRSVTATLTAQRDSDVAALASGAVRERLAAEGDTVAAGQVVVQLDDAAARQALGNARLQLRQAQLSLEQVREGSAQAALALRASLRAAEEGLAQARLSADLAAKRDTPGDAGRSERQAARTAVAQAEAALAQARSALAQNGRGPQGSVPLAEVGVELAQAAVAQAEDALARTQVRAPFAGTVSGLNAEVGEFVAQGSPVFRLVERGAVRASFSVPAGDVTALAPGAALNLSYGGVNYVATVQGGARLAGRDRLVPVTARVQGGEGLPIGAGATVRYRARLGQGTLLPTAAVQVAAGESVVYALEPEGPGAARGVVREQVVSVLAESGGQAVVSGLAPGTRVVSPLPPGLRDGSAVEVTPAGTSTGRVP